MEKGEFDQIPETLLCCHGRLKYMNRARFARFRFFHAKENAIQGAPYSDVNRNHVVLMYSYLFLSKCPTRTEEVDEARRNTAVHVKDKGLPLFGGHLNMKQVFETNGIW